MRITRSAAGPSVEFDSSETGLLRNLLAELTEMVSEPDLDDPVARRLFPAAYPEDAEAEADYHSITHDGLRVERAARIAAILADLSVDGPIALADPETSGRWLRVLNDLRLAIGTRIGVAEDEVLDRAEAESPPRLIYHWLTAVQDEVVESL